MKMLTLVSIASAVILLVTLAIFVVGRRNIRDSFSWSPDRWEHDFGDCEREQDK